MSTPTDPKPEPQVSEAVRIAADAIGDQIADALMPAVNNLHVTLMLALQRLNASPDVLAALADGDVEHVHWWLGKQSVASQPASAAPDAEKIADKIVQNYFLTKCKGYPDCGPQFLDDDEAKEKLIPLIREALAASATDGAQMFKQPPSQEWLETHADDDAPEVVGTGSASPETLRTREPQREETGFAPCPFCGDPRVNIEWEPCEPMSEGDTNRIWYAECARCGAHGPVQNRENQCKQPWNARE